MTQQITLFDVICEKKREVRQITYAETKPFILGVHYARRMPCVQYAFGLFEGGCCVDV